MPGFNTVKGDLGTRLLARTGFPSCLVKYVAGEAAEVCKALSFELGTTVLGVCKIADETEQSDRYAKQTGENKVTSPKPEPVIPQAVAPQSHPVNKRGKPRARS